MKNTLLVLSTFCLSLFSANAQNSRFPNRGCATMEEDARMRAEHPEMGTLDDFERWMEQKIVEHKAASAEGRMQTSFTIPVIVHVIHTGQAVGTSYNISTAQINSQLDVLNEDYRRLNADTSLIPAIWKSVAADCEINFCPATVDPNGLPLNTPGIERINATTRGWSISGLTNTYITNNIKPATIWNTNKYLNVWVVPDYTNGAGIDLLGYATFPAGSTLSGITSSSTSTTDGFVCWYKSYGRVGNLDPTYNKGETATHEIGHWLGLRHIWGDATCGTDYCNDTPIAQSANYGCHAHPYHLGLCSGNTTGEMFMNYMDYSDDACLYMFTNDQKTRVQTCMSNSPMRVAQAASTACNSVVSAGDDAAALQITSPVASSCATSIIPQFKLINYGNVPLTSCTINYILDSGTVSTYAWTGSISSPGYATVQLPVISGSPTFSAGVHTLKIYTSSPNGASDVNAANDTVKTNFTITNPTATAINGSNFYSQPFSVTPFTAGAYPGFSLSNPNIGSPAWSYTNTAGGFGNSTSCVRVLNYSATNPNPYAAQTDEFNTPNFDFTATNPYYLNFNVAYAKRSGAINDSLLVYVSTDCDASWTKIYGKSQNNLATNGGTSVTSSFTPTAAQWRSESIDLSSYQGNSHVRFKFKNYNGGGNNIYVDDINVSNAPLAVASTASLQNQLLLFPNPSQGTFTLTLNLASQSDVKISIIDLLGNQVYSSKKSNVKNEDIQFDLSNLAKGVYFVEVATNKEKVTRRISIVD